MGQIFFTKKQHRVRCSDEHFLKAVYASNTYKEIAEKTGQKLSSTIARYAKTKKTLADQGVFIPEMQREKSVKKIDNIDKMIKVVQRLEEHHKGE